MTTDNHTACQHQLALCKLHNCTACTHQGREANCPYAQVAANDTTPTIDEMIEIYQEHSPSCRIKKSGVIGSVISDLKALCIDTSSKCTAISWTRLNELIRILKSPDRAGGPLRDSTVRSHLSAFSAITARKLAQYYVAAGRDIPRFSMPSFDVQDFVKQSMTDDQERQFDILMERWLASGRKTDRNKFVYGYFMQEFGMRTGDILVLTWGNIKFTRDGVAIVYSPHKTSKSRPDLVVTIPMTSKQYSKIKPLMGAPDERVIPTETKYAARGVKHGSYVGKHRYLTSSFNREIYEVCGVGGEYRHAKKGYVLRKKFMTDKALKYGDEIAAKLGGDRIDMAKRHYISDRSTAWGE